MLFISGLKLFSFSRYLNFCLDFFVHVGKRLDMKTKLDFKSYDITDFQINITIHILLNISKSKGSHTMKCDIIAKYNMRNIFVGTSYSKCGREASPSPFPEKSKLSMYLSYQVLKYTVCFYCMSNFSSTKYIKTKMLMTSFDLKLFKKQKEV